MTLEQYSYLAEIIGVIVVIVTLIYMSVQIRQCAELLRSESRQAQVAAELRFEDSDRGASKDGHQIPYSVSPSHFG